MRSLIQPQFRAERIEKAAERIKDKYNPKTTEDLIQIAKEEYGVNEVIYSPVFLGSAAYRINNDIYIFYNRTIKPYERFAISHEIGHIAAGHLNGLKNPGFFTCEFEADYFAQLINNSSAIKHNLLRTADAIFLTYQMIKYPFIRKKEIQKLKELGLEEFIKQSG
ncbi:ImmA/IrrE family metallo-endopeptidase [Nanoarchaeota archaeon]